MSSPDNIDHHEECISLPPDQLTNPQQSIRRTQFTLKSLMVAVLGCGVVLGGAAKVYRKYEQAQRVREIFNDDHALVIQDPTQDFYVSNYAESLGRYEQVMMQKGYTWEMLGVPDALLIEDLLRQVRHLWEWLRDPYRTLDRECIEFTTRCMEDSLNKATAIRRRGEPNAPPLTLADAGIDENEMNAFLRNKLNEIVEVAQEHPQ